MLLPVESQREAGTPLPTRSVITTQLILTARRWVRQAEYASLHGTSIIELSPLHPYHHTDPKVNNLCQGPQRSNFQTHPLWSSS